MIQNYTRVKVADNTGARRIMCINIPGGTRRRYAYIGDIIIASSYCSHAQIIAENNSLVKWKLSSSERYPCAQSPKKEAADIPMAKGQGFYAAFDNGPTC